MQANKKLVRSGMMYLIIGFLPLASNFLIAPIFTRVLSREEYGILALAAVFQAYLSVFLDIGLKGAFARHYFDYYKKQVLIKALYSTVCLTLLMIAAATGLLLWLFGDQFFGILFINSNTFSLVPYGYIAWSSATLILLQTVTLSLYRNEENLKAYSLIAVASFLCMTTGSVLGVLYFKQGALGSLIGKLAGTAVVLIPYFVYYLSRNGLLFRKQLLRPLFAYGWPLMPYAILGLVMDNLDKIMVERYLGLGQLGLYNVAFLIASVPSILLYAVQSTINPQVYRMLAEQGVSYDLEKDEQIRKLFKVLLFFMCLVISGISMVVGPAVTLLLGSQFHEVALIVPILILAFYARSLYVVYTIPLFFNKNSKYLPITNLVAVCCGFASGLLLAPTYGLIGIGISLIIMKCSQLVPTLFFLKRTNWLHRPFFKINDVIVLMAALAFSQATIVFLLYQYPSLPRLLMGLPFIGISLYLAAKRELNILRFLKRN